MQKEPNDRGDVETGELSSGDQVVFVVHRESDVNSEVETLDLIKLWGVIWNDKWYIAGITAMFSIATIVYVLLVTEWYRAEAVLAPAVDQSTQGLAAQFGGLASLAGINVGDSSTIEPIAVLQSREFARDFIEDLDLMPVLFEDDWDSKAEQWRHSNPEEQPDIRDGVKYFIENVRRVTEDAKTGLVRLTVEWKDPEVAAVWVNLLVNRLNDRMRERALAKAEANVTFLRSEMENTNIVTIQHSIGRLLESELQKLMLARGNREFAFKTIDPAEPPIDRYRPMRAVIVILATFLGGMIGIFVVLVRHVIRERDQNSASHETA